MAASATPKKLAMLGCPPNPAPCEGRFMLKFLALFMFLASATVNAQTPLHTDLPLKYLEQANPDSHNQPLVIFLHGYGSNERDLFGIKDDLPAQYNYLSVQAPVALDEDSYQWFRTKGEGAYNGETDDLKTSGDRKSVV